MVSPFHQTRRTALFATVGACLLLFGTAGSSSGTARYGLYEFEPIFLQVAGTITLGQPAACTVELTGAPATITIYSDPPGVVSYQGTVSSATQTVQAATNANAAAGSVTVYVKTDGTQIVMSSTTARLPVMPTSSQNRDSHDAAPVSTRQVYTH